LGDVNEREEREERIISSRRKYEREGVKTGERKTVSFVTAAVCFMGTSQHRLKHLKKVG
jgi:hypothetical protein